MATELVLIRHGITEWNRKLRYCGAKDINLSRDGRSQAERLASALKDFQFYRAYSSDRKRAIQTSNIIFKGSRITRLKALREINFGILEGLTHEEIMKKYKDAYGKWLKDPFTNHIPMSEPMNAFKKRVHSVIKKIARVNQGRTAAIVCHGGVIAIFVSTILKTRNFWQYVPSEASITIVEYKKFTPRIKRFNSIEHLR